MTRLSICRQLRIQYIFIDQFIIMHRGLFVKRIPKVELHAHLGGSCPKQKLLLLLTQYGYQDQIERINNPKFGFGEWFQAQFSASALLMKTKKGLEDYVAAVVQNFQGDNVVYLELRTTPRAGEDYTVKQFFEILRDVCKRYYLEIKVKIIVSLNRDSKDIGMYQSIIETVQSVEDWRQYIVGLDVSGNPSSRPFSDFTHILSQGRSIGLKITVHTAEIEAQMAETPEILDFIPDRIGHFSSYSQEELDFVIKNQIAVEVCIWSGKVTKKRPSILDLTHVKQFYHKKVRYCICTDDIMLFGKDVSDELINYLDIVGEDQKHCYALMVDSVRYIFDKSEQKFILDRLEEFRSSAFSADTGIEQ